MDYFPIAICDLSRMLDIGRCQSLEIPYGVRQHWRIDSTITTQWSAGARVEANLKVKQGLSFHWIPNLPMEFFLKFVEFDFHGKLSYFFLIRKCGSRYHSEDVFHEFWDLNNQKQHSLIDLEIIVFWCLQLAKNFSTGLNMPCRDRLTAKLEKFGIVVVDC